MIDDLMLEAQCIDQEDEKRRESIAGKYCIRAQAASIHERPSVSRNKFVEAKQPGKKVIFE